MSAYTLASARALLIAFAVLAAWCRWAPQVEEPVASPTPEIRLTNVSGNHTLTFPPGDYNGPVCINTTGNINGVTVVWASPVWPSPSASPWRKQ